MKKEEKPIEEGYSLYKMSQQEVADALGVSRNTVNKLEKSALEKFRRILFEKYGKDIDNIL